MSVREVFDQQFSAMESIVGVRYEGDDLAARLESLYKSNRKISYAEREVFTAFGTSFFRAARITAPQLGKEDISENIVKVILSALIPATTFNQTRGKPRRHHWLPVAYLRGFSSDSVRTSNNVRAVVSGVQFRNGVATDVEEPDRAFIHRKNGFNGFYHDMIENAFGRMEAYYATYVNKSGEGANFASVVATAMFVLQSIRSPHPSTGFSARTIREVVDGIINTMDTMGPIYTKFGNSRKPLPVTPYVPTRTRILADGNRVYFYPIHSGKALLIFSNPPRVNPIKVVADCRRAVICHVRKNDGVIYGVTSKNL